MQARLSALLAEMRNGAATSGDDSRQFLIKLLEKEKATHSRYSGHREFHGHYSPWSLSRTPLSDFLLHFIKLSNPNPRYDFPGEIKCAFTQNLDMTIYSRSIHIHPGRKQLRCFFTRWTDKH